MLHHPLQGQPTEKPFAVYVAEAEHRIAHTRATGNELNGTRSRDGDLASAMAVLARASDRSKGRGL